MARGAAVERAGYSSLRPRNLLRFCVLFFLLFESRITKAQQRLEWSRDIKLQGDLLGANMIAGSVTITLGRHSRKSEGAKWDGAKTQCEVGCAGRGRGAGA